MDILYTYSLCIEDIVKRPFPSQKIAKDWVGFDPESSPSKVVIRSTIPPPINDYSFLLYPLGNSVGLTIYMKDSIDAIYFIGDPIFYSTSAIDKKFYGTIVRRNVRRTLTSMKEGLNHHRKAETTNVVQRKILLSFCFFNFFLIASSLLHSC